jgi:hypothetical protein
MADVSISSLTQSIPAGNSILPYSTGSNTLGVPVSAVLQNAGNIGIGTNNPNRKLHIFGSHGDTMQRLQSTGGNGTGNSGPANLLLWASEPGYTFTGCGIGANVAGSDTGNDMFRRVDSTNGQSYIRFLPNDGTMRFYTGLGDAPQGMIIDSNGNVGIGMAPSTKLEVNGTIKATAITLTAFNKAILSDVKAVATPGGDATRDFWNKRTLNTKTDPGNIVTLSNDVFTLGAGKYVVNASAPAYRTHEHQIRLYRVGAAAGVVQYGTTEFSNYGGGYAQTRSFLCCLLDITENTSYQIEHWVNYRNGVTETLGITNIVSSGAPSIFTTVEITKI